MNGTIHVNRESSFCLLSHSVPKSDTESQKIHFVFQHSFYVIYIYIYNVFDISFHGGQKGLLIPSFRLPFHQVLCNHQTEPFLRPRWKLSCPVWNRVQKHRCRSRNQNLTNENCCHSLQVEKYEQVSTDYFVCYDFSRKFTYHTPRFECSD